MLVDGKPVATADDTATHPVGRLVSVNVGLPRDVPWHGQTVHTGVWKYPVDGPQMVRRLNIDGDGQGDLGGHGGPHRAVMVYQLDSYQHWREEFGRDDLTPGQFGENFTVEGLSDDQVCIGDQFEIGDALFEVSQPRVTCYRVGMRLGEPRLPALLVSHHRPGFYLRVLREGAVQAGDRVVKVRSGDEQMTVAEVDALLYLPGHPRQAIARALRIAALSPGWQGSFQSLLAVPADVAGNVGLSDAGIAPPLAWTGFRRFRVVGIDRESGTVDSLRLAPAEGDPPPPAAPGQFVALRVTPDGATSPVIRSYSLSGAAGLPDYRVSVKLEPHGVLSGFVHQHLRIGAPVELSAPRGSFILAPGDGPVLLVSAGVGATPLLAMLHALADEKSTRPVCWLYGARNSAEHPFAAEVRALLAELPQARSEICYSAPLTIDITGRDYQHRGRLDEQVLRKLDIPPDAHAYLCGPESFMADIGATLATLGLPAAQISTEMFGARPAITPGIAATAGRPPHQPAGEPGTGPDITFSRSGLTAAWRPGTNSILDFAEACDVPTRWSCRTGICHTCETGLLAGTVEYEPAPIDLPADNNVLICCARPKENLVIDL
jgi:ferredoxin-NADP reductase/MOSC domain-containing protein YiiM